ncbi:hypothetical protein Clacol_001607 [Clathrus columnatus]|uniref:60S ribosomal protein L6 n=1 Tax=Clathrus columnatus TaxID=1419009 RepID=A0AAV5A672_9AGAM|nr:hypothetical protein Clacol_001607 [Clathrus columnatus]
MARNRPIAAHIGRLSRSKVKAYRGLFKGIKKSDAPAKPEESLTKEVTVGGEKNGGKRLVPTKKAALFYPAEDVRQPKKSRKTHHTAKLRSSISPGTVLILLAGRFRGKRVVFLKQLPSGLLLVTGPYALNGVPLRRVNQAYVIATSTKIDVSGLQLKADINDAYFAKPNTSRRSDAESEFFADGKPKEKAAYPEAKASEQKNIDNVIVEAVKKTENVAKYLKASWVVGRALSRRVNGNYCFHVVGRRALFTETIQGLSAAFLDSAIGLPYPPEWPAYTTTIILTGILSRITIFPFLYWSWKRERRLEENVLPYLRTYHAKLKSKAVTEIEGTSNNPKAKEFFNQAVKKKLSEKRKELLKQHRCSPWLTMAISSVPQLPMFVLLSSTFLYISNEPGSVFKNEAIFSLQSLSHPDPTAAIPVMTGLISLATTETSHWFTNHGKEDVPKLSVNNNNEERQITVRPTRYIKSVIRVLALGRVILTFLMPAASAVGVEKTVENWIT